uniref:Amino acid transporter transmembrane domain-containing protein n=1 Tax=Timema bartmani TaxID=61472 RepID=A0A7R9F5P2_9NEOP|nr:unnamed protein product [Timema bartmani]
MSLKLTDLKQGPSSLTITRGAPNNAHTRLQRALTVVGAFMLRRGISITNLEKASTNTRIQELPKEERVCDNYIEEIDLRLYGLMMLVPMLAINCVRNLKFLAPFSAVALLMSLVSYVIIWSYAFRDLHPLSERAMVGQLSNLPLFLGSVFFIYEPVPTVLPMRHAMKRPQSWGGIFGVFHLGTIIVIVINFIMGFSGYMAYGDDAKGSITLNLPQDQPLAQSVTLMQCLAIFFSQALQNYLAVEVMWDGYLLPKLHDHKYKLLLEFSFRAALVFIECEGLVVSDGLTVCLQLVLPCFHLLPPPASSCPSRIPPIWFFPKVLIVFVLAACALLLSSSLPSPNLGTLLSQGLSTWYGYSPITPPVDISTKEAPRPQN